MHTTRYDKQQPHHTRTKNRITDHVTDGQYADDHLSTMAWMLLDLRSRGRWFDYRSDRYQVVITWMGDCPGQVNHLAIYPTPRSNRPSISP